MATKEFKNLDKPVSVVTIYADDGNGNAYSVGTASVGATRTAVNDSATSVQLIGSNSTRKGLTIRNTSSVILHVCPGTQAATAMSAVASLLQDERWDAPPLYLGPVQGIWVTDANDGVAVVVEYA